VNDKLFDDEADPFWDDPTAGAKGKSKSKKQCERIDGRFYQCSEPWCDRAAEACGQYLILALRLYRRWRARAPGADWIFASSATFRTGREGRNGRLCVLTRLEVAGLIEIAGRKNGQAYRVRVIDPQLRT
jgi:hypothetical protein